ncbi:MAG: carboxypeptidase-like regulatory domain-containing protein [Planctomycetota bacterium]
MRIIPYASLLWLAVLVVLAFASKSPALAPFSTPPALPPLASPDLGLGAATLAGVVVDPSGRAVPDAGLVALAGKRVRSTWTDREGRFTLTRLPEGALDLAVIAQGFEPNRTSVTPGPDPVRVELGRAIRPAPMLPGLAALDLVGKVAFTPLETPAEGYELALLPVLGVERIDAGAPRRTLVAPDGTYRVPRLAPGEYEVLLLPPDARGGLWPNLLTGADLNPLRHDHPAPPTEELATEFEPVRLDLHSRAGSLEGRLTDRRRARGAAWLGGALVRVEPIGANGEPDPVRVVWAVSGEDGAWSVRHLPPGRYHIALAAGEERRDVDVIVREQQRVRSDL